MQRIGIGVIQCDEAYRRFLDLDHKFDIAEAKAYLRANGSPAHERKYIAIEDTEQERADRDVADAAYRLCDRQMKALMAELDALRSIGTSVRQAYVGAGRGEF